MLAVPAAIALEATGVGVMTLFVMTAGLVALAGCVVVGGAELIAVALETIGAEAGTAWVAAPVGAAIEVAVMTGAVPVGAATG